MRVNFRENCTSLKGRNRFWTNQSGDTYSQESQQPPYKPWYQQGMTGDHMIK